MLGTDQTLGDPAVELGPIWLVGFTRSSGPAVIALEAGGLTKVLIRPSHVPGETVALRGQDCSSGRALRFCYGPSRSACRDKGAGVTVQKVDLTGLDDTGYILFPGVGDYRLWVTLSAQQLGGAVVDVRAPAA